MCTTVGGMSTIRWSGSLRGSGRDLKEEGVSSSVEEVPDHTDGRFSEPRPDPVRRLWTGGLEVPCGRRG